MVHSVKLRETQLPVKLLVASCNNDSRLSRGYLLRMTQITRIHAGKTPRRAHYIAEWMERRGRKQADLARATGADKATVSRWIGDGVIPSEKYLEPLALFLDAEEVAALFRHPDDDWLARLFRDRSDDERQRLRQLIDAAFPERVA